MTANAAITIDLNDLANGPVKLDSFTEVVNGLDVNLYADKEVQIKGCAPTWAHLMVAGRLFPHAKKLSFLIDDQANGKPITVFEKNSFRL